MERYNVTSSLNSEGLYNHSFSVRGYRFYRSGGINWNELVIDTPTLTLVGPNQEGAIREIKRMFDSSNATEIHIVIHSYTD